MNLNSVIRSIFGILLTLLVLTMNARHAAAQVETLGITVNPLDLQLESVLRFAASDGKGLDYFILPDAGDLKSIPSDTNNPLTPQKVKLGQLLFHETALTINPINPKHWQQASCASCHLAKAGFRSDLQQALGVGGFGVGDSRHRDEAASLPEIDKPDILAPSVLNSAYQSVQPWNGRFGSHGLNLKEKTIRLLDVNRFDLDGLETLAISALTTHRMGTSAISTIPEYQKLFEMAFPEHPYVGSGVEDLKYAGLAMAAYMRTLLPSQAPFQRWLKGEKSAMTKQEKQGAIKFFTSSCVQCHTGPNLAKDGFYAVGFQDHPEDFTGLNLGRGTITKNPKDDFKFKSPQLYNLADNHHYGHGGSFHNVREVVEYFNNGQPQNLASLYSKNISVWFKPLDFTSADIENLTLFLEKSLRDPDLSRYVPKKIPSNLCFPNNDPESRLQLGCGV